MAMTPEEFREALHALGLKQTGDHGASTFLGVGDVTVRRWASGKIPVPGAVEMLFRVMMRHRFKPETVRKLVK